MKRSTFLITSLLALPGISFARIRALLRTGKGFLVPAGKNRNNTDTKYGSGSINYLKISQEDTDGELCVFEAVADGRGGPRLHVHNDQDEIIVVTEGKFRVQVGEHSFDAGIGDTVFMPRKVAHTIASIGEGRSKLINIYQPAGKIEAFFTVLGKRSSRPSLEETKEIFRSHGMEIVGPPISLD